MWETMLNQWAFVLVYLHTSVSKIMAANLINKCASYLVWWNCKGVFIWIINSAYIAMKLELQNDVSFDFVSFILWPVYFWSVLDSLFTLLNWREKELNELPRPSGRGPRPSQAIFMVWCSSHMLWRPSQASHSARHGPATLVMQGFLRAPPCLLFASVFLLFCLFSFRPNWPIPFIPPIFQLHPHLCNLIIFYFVMI